MNSPKLNPKNHIGKDKLGRAHWIQQELLQTEAAVKPSIKELNYSDWVHGMGKNPKFKQLLDEHLKANGISPDEVDNAIAEHAKAQNLDMFGGDKTDQSERSKFVVDKLSEYYRKDGDDNDPLLAYFRGIRHIHSGNPSATYIHAQKSANSPVSILALFTGQIKLNKQGHTLVLAPVEDGEVRRWQLFNDKIREDHSGRIGYGGFTDITERMTREDFPELPFCGFLNLKNLKSIRIEARENESGKVHTVTVEKDSLKTHKDAKDLVLHLIRSFDPKSHQITMAVPIQHLQPFGNPEKDSWEMLKNAGVIFTAWDELYSEKTLEKLSELPLAAFSYSETETGMTTRFFGNPYLVTLAPDEETPILFPASDVTRAFSFSEISGQPMIRKADGLIFNRHYSFFEDGKLTIMNAFVADDLLKNGLVNADMNVFDDIDKELISPFLEDDSPETKQIRANLLLNGINLEVHDKINPFLNTALNGLALSFHNEFSPDVYDYIKKTGLTILINRATYDLQPDEIKASYFNDKYEDTLSGETKEVHYIQIFKGDPFNFIHEFTHYLDFSGYFNGIDKEKENLISLLEKTESIKKLKESDLSTVFQMEAPLDYLLKPSEIFARFTEQIASIHLPDSPLTESPDAFFQLTNAGYWTESDINEIRDSREFKEFAGKLGWKLFGSILKSLFYSLMGLIRLRRSVEWPKPELKPPTIEKIIPEKEEVPIVIENDIMSTYFPIMKSLHHNEGETKPGSAGNLTFWNCRWHDDTNTTKQPETEYHSVNDDKPDNITTF